MKGRRMKRNQIKGKKIQKLYLQQIKNQKETCIREFRYVKGVSTVINVKYIKLYSCKVIVSPVL